MQPPGGGGSQRHGVSQPSAERQHTCSSAFSAPPQPLGHHHAHAVREPTGYLHGKSNYRMKF